MSALPLAPAEPQRLSDRSALRLAAFLFKNEPTAAHRERLELAVLPKQTEHLMVGLRDACIAALAIPPQEWADRREAAIAAITQAFRLVIDAEHPPKYVKPHRKPFNDD